MIELFLNTTTAKVAIVTIKNDSSTVSQVTGDSPLPTIQKALSKANLSLSKIDKFTANPGPGSYTGIRVGLSVVNALNFSMGKVFDGLEPIYN